MDLRSREHRRRRIRRHGRRAYIRSAYSLPSLATLGNAVCGFAAMYVSTLAGKGPDRLTNWFYDHNYIVSAYLIFVAMLFDGLDGRLARFTRHTTDFGGQLDSLSDVISFGAAPAFLALQVIKSASHNDLPPMLSRLIWAIGALFLSCAAIRLARFNVSNDHGEQHHFSFLGLPSPGAGGAVAALVLMQQTLAHDGDFYAATYPASASVLSGLSVGCIWLLPLLVLGTGLLMVSHIRYPHIVNRYLRGRQSLGRLLFVFVLLLALVVAHRYTLGVGMIAYVGWGVIGWVYYRLLPRRATSRPGGPALALSAPPPPDVATAPNEAAPPDAQSPRLT